MGVSGRAIDSMTELQVKPCLAGTSGSTNKSLLDQLAPGKESGGEPIPAQNVLDLDLDEGSETEENKERINIRPPPRRSNRERRPTDFYGDTVHLTIHQEPSSFNEARSSPEKDQWSRAMDMEMESLRTNEVWELTTLPPAVGSKWVYKVKTGGDGAVQRYKASGDVVVVVMWCAVVVE